MATTTSLPLLGQCHATSRPLRRHAAGGAARGAAPPRSVAAATRSTSLRVAGVRCAVQALRSGGSDVEVPPRSVPVRVAYELQQAGHRYLDVSQTCSKVTTSRRRMVDTAVRSTSSARRLCVTSKAHVAARRRTATRRGREIDDNSRSPSRTEGEFSAGHPEGALNIPYMNKTGSGMTKNTHFLEQVSRIFGKDDEIIVGCQSGKRSLMAATELCSAGFTAVTDIAGGFSSWRENGLPIIQ